MKRLHRTDTLSMWWWVLVLAACTTQPVPRPPDPVSGANHRWFPIAEGSTHAFGKSIAVDGSITCDSCHRPSAESFKSVRCDHCHKHSERITERLHLGLPSSFAVDTSAVSEPELKAEIRGAHCVSCHPTGEPRAFSHTLIVDECAQCHAPESPFAALPRDGFTHPDVGQADCGGCHITSTWQGAGLAPNDSRDPSRDVSVTALMPTFSGASIARLSPLEQLLPMPMNHSANALDSVVKSDCKVCHVDAAVGAFFPGQLHWSLSNAGQAQPGQCNECHARSQPQGYVGPLASSRSPASGPMRHDAVSWSGDAPTSNRLVTTDCSVCHRPPGPNGDTTWLASEYDGGAARFHASLTAAGQSQPASCIDCHANSRPTSLLTSANAAIPPGMTVDHQAPWAMTDCVTCHASTTAWAGGQFHASTSAPTSCVSCHAGERPTSTAGWQSTTYTQTPFDYGTNAQGVTHGAGEDCAGCHASTQTWVGGHFAHGPGTVAATTCIACHLSQRPESPVPPTGTATTAFDHLANGMGDCRACHQATVRRGVYLNYQPIPGGDWRGGVEYPGDILSSSQTQFVALTAYGLTRSPTNFVTGITTQSLTFYNGMLHTSDDVPAQVDPGPVGSPNSTSCWHCHTHAPNSTTVTAYADGKFHSALTNYSATPAGTPGATPLPQPTRCRDCHEQMRPNLIVQKSGSPLQSMDHSATFAAPALIAGQTVSAVSQLDCAICHQSTPGSTWADGRFHANIGSATPADCIGCHYPLSVTSMADVASSPPTTFSMKHRSPSLATLQRCDTCHATALANATRTPLAGTLWRLGQFHSQVSPQPAACLECHSNSEPATASQGTTVYTLTQGATATNQAQWMNHLVPDVTGRDCAFCHAADAKASGSAWNRMTAYHAKVTPTACSVCHGTGNGRGSTVGTNNNLPAGLIDTQTTTTASPFPGVKDQISHADINVTGHDCGFCHTQKGPSTVAGIQGVEWRQASFHARFSAANPLVLNGSTGRCSNCHLNVKPGASYTLQDHSAFTATSTQDCSACHAWPGQGTATAPNWLGATGAHASSGSTAGSTLDCNTCHGQSGSAATRLKVPVASHFGGTSNGNKCISCHINFAGFKGTVTNLKYAHSNATANAGGCITCHAFASQLYTTLTTTPPLTRPTVAGGHQFSQTLSVTGSHDGDSFTSAHTNTNLTLCGSCHQYAATTATTNIWAFRHEPSNPGITNKKSTGGCTMCH